jgi:hypothetical protein
MTEDSAGDQSSNRTRRRRRGLVGSLVALLALVATLVPASPADAAIHVGIGEPRVISTSVSSSGIRVTLGVRVRSAKNVKQVRIYLFTPRTNHKLTVVGHLSKGTNNYGYWTGSVTFTREEGGTFRVGKVRVLGSRYRLLRSKAIAKNTAAVLAVIQRDELALVANGRTQGPRKARTTKFAIRMLSDTEVYEYRNAPVRLTGFFRRPSGEIFRRSLETRSNENGKSIATFGPYHMARVKALAIDLPNADGPSIQLYTDF